MDGQKELDHRALDGSEPSAPVVSEQRPDIMRKAAEAAGFAMLLTAVKNIRYCFTPFFGV
jgi:hypothetical protein